MAEIDFSGLLIVMAVAFSAPLVLGTISSTTAGSRRAGARPGSLTGWLFTPV